MSLPPFLTRIHNAAGPILGGISESELGERLEASRVTLEIDDAHAQHAGHRAGYLLAVNLAARFYPSLRLDAPPELVNQAAALVRAINPGCALAGESAARSLKLTWRNEEPGAERVIVSASHWNVVVDDPAPVVSPAAPPAAMAAAALGLGELFRCLFADKLTHERSAPATVALNLISLGEPSEIPYTPEQVDVGVVHLVGCGAIGQAAVAALAHLPVTGTLHAVDHDRLDEGNLQRYLLSFANDLDKPKPELVARALAGHGLQVVEIDTRWGSDERSGPGCETVLCALDSKQGRIELQAGLPRQIFNAWTQPQDIGVSRHGSFGNDPCLACLMWPRHKRPSESESIARALNEHELRVLLYIGTNAPVGRPLPDGAIEGTLRLPVPDGSEVWTRRSLLDDLADRFSLDRAELEPFADLQIQRLYRDTVCAGVLMEHADDERGGEVSVPLAHQSALAGIMLATWLFADRSPALRKLLPDATQARYDVLRGAKQVWPRHRGRAPGCICADPDFQAVFQGRWSSAARVRG